MKIEHILEENAAALIFTPTARLYLTGFQSSLGYLIISKKERILFIDGRYFEAAKKAVLNADVCLLENFSEQINGYVKKNNIKTILLENAITVGTLKLFQKKLSVQNISSSDVLSDTLLDLRSIKTTQEIISIKKAQIIAEKAFEGILNFIKSGVTENQIAAELEYRMKLLGSERPSFETIAVAGKKSSMPHGVPDDSIVKPGDFITMDFGAVVNGYHSDMTRTVAVGFATDEMSEVYEAVLAAQLSALATIKSGKQISEVDNAARAAMGKYEKYFTHSTGHGVGLEIHEYPNVSNKMQGSLRTNQIITVEPGVYIAGHFGVRIEDMAVVTENGHENLTKSEKNLIIL
ncbi:MAG: Xaa-Pro peptidase family protein [Oscillospiraceae bacterium]